LVFFYAFVLRILRITPCVKVTIRFEMNIKQFWTSILPMALVAVMTLLGCASCGDKKDNPVEPPPPPNHPQILVTPMSYDFGLVEIGLESGATFNIRNTGQVTLTVDSMKLDAGPFRLEGSVHFSLSANQSVERVVHFEPSEADSFTSTLGIYSNDPDVPVVHISLCGRSAADHFPDPVITGTNESVIINSIIGLQVIDGTEAACMSTAGAVYGKEKLNPADQHWGLALWGDDTTTPVRDGFLEGDTLCFMLWDPAGRREIAPEVTVVLGGELRYTTNGLLVLRFEVR